MSRRLVPCIGLLVWIVAAGEAVLYAEPTYVGVQRCASKTCHGAEILGNQFEMWQNTAHAKAYKTLGTDKAKEFASKAGLKDDPQKSPKFLKCHVTAYGVGKSSISDAFKAEDGIQCESCHGPGSDYISLKIMNRPKFKEDRKGQQKLFLEAGGIMPTEKDCVRCHNKESPAYKGFAFAESLKKIAHPVPGK